MQKVVAALIWKDDKFLICQRPANKQLGLMWEFVGGKVEEGESNVDALIRECKEELGIKIAVDGIYMEIEYSYPNFDVDLFLYDARIEEGTPKLLEHNDMRWISIDEIDEYDFCPADYKFLDNLKELKPIPLSSKIWTKMYVIE